MVPVPCHNHTSSLLTTSQTLSLVHSVEETMQLSSPAVMFFPPRKLDVVLHTGLCRVIAVLAALKYPPGLGFKCLLFISMWTIFMNSICAASFWISSYEKSVENKGNIKNWQNILCYINMNIIKEKNYKVMSANLHGLGIKSWQPFFFW